MQDLSERVQSVATQFFQARSNKTFTNLYQILLPEASKMLKSFIKDPQVIEDLSSRIFEAILFKPSIYFNAQIETEFEEIATRYFGTKCKHYIYYAPVAQDSTTGQRHIKSYYAPEEKSDVCHAHVKRGALSSTDVAKLWLVVNQRDSYNIMVPDELNQGRYKMVKVVDFIEFNKSTKLSLINIEKLRKDCPAPFVYRPDKPFLHYFSKIVKTNALSSIKKAKNHDQSFADMYFGYDDEDKPQLIANQLTDENDRIEELHKEQDRIMDEQKFMIIYDIIQQTIPENQRGIMIDAILMKLDYAKIALKYGLLKVTIDGMGTFDVVNIDQDRLKITAVEHRTNRFGEGYAHKFTISHIERLPNTAEVNLLHHMGKKDRLSGQCSMAEGKDVKFRLIDGTGLLKSRVHRYKKQLDQQIAKTPQFTTQCDIDTYTTYYSGDRVRMQVDILEMNTDVVKTIYHGHYISYYSTGEVREMGRYSLNKRQGIWYTFYKNGQIMKRGMYSTDKQDGHWHHFDIDGKLNTKYHYHNGTKGYYEAVQEDGEFICGNMDSNQLPIPLPKPTLNDILASKLCPKYDNELSYSALHIEIPQEC